MTEGEEEKEPAANASRNQMAPNPLLFDSKMSAMKYETSNYVTKPNAIRPLAIGDYGTNRDFRRNTFLQGSLGPSIKVGKIKASQVE